MDYYDLLTEPEKEPPSIYEYIVEYTKQNLFPPSIEEIRIATGLGSKTTVWSHLKKLESMGLIEVKRNVNRGIKLLGYELREIDKK